MKRLVLRYGVQALFVSLLISVGAIAAPPEPLPGTAPLTLEGDIASELVAGADRFLLRKLAESIPARTRYWQLDKSSVAAYQKGLEPHRQRLEHILGLGDPRVACDAPELVATTQTSAVVARGANYEVLAVRWPAFGDVHGEGLLLRPTSGAPTADVIAVPDADQTPEQIAGVVPGVAAQSQFARRLAESGCRVLVPVLISREMQPRNQRAVLTNREYIYRSAFELGRHLIGYELQKILAGVDWFSRDAGGNDPKIAVVGYGEGGLLALYAGALDPRIDTVAVSGYFDSRQNIWQEPIDRNVFGLLERFGDAELAAMIAPRKLIVEAARGPELEISGAGGGAPARLVTPALAQVQAEAARAQNLATGLMAGDGWIQLLVSDSGRGPFFTDQTLDAVLQSVAAGTPLTASGEPPQDAGGEIPVGPRQQRQIHELDRHNQRLLQESPYVRQEFMKKLDTSSLDKYRATVEPYRDYFRQEVIGHFPDERLAPHARDPPSLRRTQVDRLRGGARRFSRRDRLRHPAAAQGHCPRRAAAGRGLPTRLGRTAARRGGGEP